MERVNTVESTISVMQSLQVPDVEQNFCPAGGQWYPASQKVSPKQQSASAGIQL
jgi:hypothetical protein